MPYFDSVPNNHPTTRRFIKLLMNGAPEPIRLLEALRAFLKVIPRRVAVDLMKSPAKRNGRDDYLRLLMPSPPIPGLPAEIIGYGQEQADFDRAEWLMDDKRQGPTKFSEYNLPGKHGLRALIINLLGDSAKHPPVTRLFNGNIAQSDFQAAIAAAKQVCRSKPSEKVKKIRLASGIEERVIRAKRNDILSEASLPGFIEKHLGHNDPDKFRHTLYLNLTDYNIKDGKPGPSLLHYDRALGKYWTYKKHIPKLRNRGTRGNPRSK